MQSKISAVYFYSYITWNVSEDPEKLGTRNVLMRASKILTEPYKETGPKTEPQSDKSAEKLKWFRLVTKLIKRIVVKSEQREEIIPFTTALAGRFSKRELLVVMEMLMML